MYLSRIVIGPVWNFDHRTDADGDHELWLQRWDPTTRQYEDILELSTLTEKMIWLYATGQAPGNLTLSGDDWNEECSVITSLKVWTASTDWDLWLCETDAFDTALIGSRKLIANQNGNYEVYESSTEYKSDDTNVYLVYVDNSGANNAEIQITGVARRH